MGYIYFNSSYVPCGFLIVPNEGDPYDEEVTVLIQTDWDFPAVATRMGWEVCCGEGSTDGTIDCPDCGKTASEMITGAYNFIKEHEVECYPALDEYLNL